MVVIRESVSGLKERFGPEFIVKLKEFSLVIGFSLEIDDDIKVEFNPDRPDLFSFTTLDHMEKLYYQTKKEEIPTFKSDTGVIRLDPDSRSIRQFIAGFTATGNKISEDLDRLIDFQEKLHLSVGRNRKNVSIGIHDASGLKPPFRLEARDGDSISFETYDGAINGTATEIIRNHPKGREFAHLIPNTGKVAILLDSEGSVLSMPPIINGSKTLVTQNTSEFLVDITGDSLSSVRSVLYDLAYFFHYLGYSIKFHFPDKAMEKFFNSFNRRRINLDLDHVRRLIGEDIGAEEVRSLLGRMGYSLSGGTDLGVLVPGNRSDVMGPVDIIEDIAKAKGYDSIIPTQPLIQVIGRELPARRFQNGVRDLMLGLGFQETLSYVVTSADLYVGSSYGGKVEIENPKSLDFSVVRDRLYLNLLDFLRLNRSRALPQKVFEIGDIIENGEQLSHLCIASIHNKANYSEILSIVDYIVMRISGGKPEIWDQGNSHFINGRSGSIMVNGKKAGYLGEVNPETLVKFDLKSPVIVAEINLDHFMGMM